MREFIKFLVTGNKIHFIISPRKKELIKKECILKRNVIVNNFALEQYGVEFRRRVYINTFYFNY